MIDEKIVFSCYGSDKQVAVEVTVEDGEIEFESVHGLRLVDAQNVLRELAVKLEQHFPDVW